MPRFISASIVYQIVLATLALILLGITAVGGATYYSLRADVMNNAVRDTREAVRVMALFYDLKAEGGRVDVTGDTLRSFVRESVDPLPDHDFVDRTAISIGGVATLFQTQGSDYVRISTNVKNEKGERAIGTKLAPDHPAHPLLARGEAYFGPAVLFGKDFMTGYFPVKTPAGANAGILFVGIPMEVYFAQITGLRDLILLTGMGSMFLVGLLAYIMISRSIRPLSVLTATIRDISGGRLDAQIPFLQRRNEFGNIARALEVFRDNAYAKVEIESRSASERAEAEAARIRNDAEKQEMDRQIDFAVSQLASGLARLAQGDLSRQIETPFNGQLEQLRVDFNDSVSHLREALAGIRESTLTIQQNGTEMRRSSDNLSKRTESQAAALEETAAAVEEITVTVKSSAERAKEANRAVEATRANADNSASVVSDAINAMGRIEEASKKIEQIIEVIDDIAFQTNLLALNAGIEAARAGEAGKGFAVVAQEVRELAQRSADAAREIKTLINQSSDEVGSGALLVQETGKVLSAISEQIVVISGHVNAIATASQDQSSALQEVNGSVNQMDQMTQQNAAMAEETSASSRLLADEADALLALVQRFRIEAEAAGQYQQGRAA